MIDEAAVASDGGGSMTCSVDTHPNGDHVPHRFVRVSCGTGVSKRLFQFTTEAAAVAFTAAFRAAYQHWIAVDEQDDGD